METVEKTLENIETGQVQKLPFLVKASAYFWIVYGLINMVYYSTVFVYSFINHNFLHELQYADFKGNWLLMPIVFKILINGALGFSGLWILKRKKTGYTIFNFAISISILFSTFFLSYFNLVDFIAGLTSFVIFMFYRNR